MGTAEDRWNLSYAANCHRSTYVTPKKGKAILWYSHFNASCPTGETSGCKLGPMDPYSLHGGCDVHTGIKWAANNWINVEDDQSKVKRLRKLKGRWSPLHGHARHAH